MRGKYDRSTAQKHRKWDEVAEQHWEKVHKASLLGEEHCSADCPNQGQCMTAAFTVSTLRKCAAR
eukprot:1109461-Pleurochrysis_carterae.AAC.1